MFPIKYIDNNLVWNKDNEVFAYYELIQLYLFMQKAKYNEAFGVALVLLVIVLGINGLAKYMSHRFNVEAGA